jgi:CheY-like chemotaxis protein
VNRALEAARARAEAALQAKSDSLVNLSQEIRTPLVAILGYAELLRAGGSDDEQREHADMIYRQGESVLAVLSDLFDLACVESGRLTLTRRPTSVLEIGQEIVGSFATAAREKGLELALETLGPVPSTIECDPQRLRQILRHLVHNAIKFTPSGSIRVALDMDLSTPDTPRLRIAVIDTGVGIRPEAQGRLFEAFASLDSQLIREHGGAGLGLVLSKRLAQHLGGDLTVESASGKGSTFTCTVRAGDISAATMIDAPRGPIPSAKTKEAGELASLERMSVLVVEDVPTTAKLFRHFLESAGAKVEVAEDGARGVDRALAAEKRGEPFDVVLMDIQLPVMDGFDATRALRQAGYRRPIVAVTACSLQGDREKCIEAGCDSYASKPLGREALVRVCKEVGTVQWTR